MAWTKLGFGVYPKKTLPQVMWLDPDWFFWCYDEGIFARRDMQQEAEKINKLARNVKIPGNDNGEFEMFFFHDPWPDSGFTHMQKHRKGSSTIHIDSDANYKDRDVIDFRIPKDMKAKDAYGYELFLKKLKKMFFRDAEYKMTKRRSEKFFDNDDNFVWAEDE